MPKQTPAQTIAIINKADIVFTGVCQLLGSQGAGTPCGMLWQHLSAFLSFSAVFGAALAPWMAGDLSVSLPAVNPCCYYPCQHQGVCVRVGLEGYECDCTRTGYFGANCTSRKSPSRRSPGTTRAALAG